MSSKSSKYYANNPEKRKEHRDNYIENLGPDKWKKINRERCQKYRDNKRNEYREYQRDYWREYLKNPTNKFVHGCRTCLRSKIKETKTYKAAIDSGKNADHIIPVRTMVAFFKKRELFHPDDLALTRTLREVINISHNIRYIKCSQNNRGVDAKIKQQLRVAEKLEKSYSYLCKGLSDFIVEFNNE